MTITSKSTSLPVAATLLVWYSKLTFQNNVSVLLLLHGYSCIFLDVPGYSWILLNTPEYFSGV